MPNETLRITTIPNAYINWVEKSRFGFSKSYSYEIYIRNERIEHASNCDLNAYKRLKGTAQLMCLGSFRQIYRSTYDSLLSEKFLRYAKLLKNTFIAENFGEERSRIVLKLKPASWNEGTTDPNGNAIKIISVTLRAEPISSQFKAHLEYEYSKPNRVGVFKELMLIEPYEMDQLIRFARCGVLCGMEDRRVFGYIEFNNPNEIILKARQLDYIEIISDNKMF